MKKLLLLVAVNSAAFMQAGTGVGFDSAFGNNFLKNKSSNWRSWGISGLVNPIITNDRDALEDILKKNSGEKFELSKKLQQADKQRLITDINKKKELCAYDNQMTKSKIATGLFFATGLVLLAAPVAYMYQDGFKNISWEKAALNAGGVTTAFGCAVLQNNATNKMMSEKIDLHGLGECAEKLEIES